ncbi:MAG: NADP-dependent oxidoreductase [Rhizobiaceae bacterium]|nr:NADP-dependent oxidoreductase [Rhizobiaceae bacterium]
MADTVVRLARRPAGAIMPEDFVLAPVDVGPLAEGDVLVRPAFISLDPYLSIQVYGRPVRGVAFAPGQAMLSRMVGRVVESRHASLREGDLVLGMGPWQSRFVVAGSALERLEIQLDRPELHLSVLGSSGITGWLGLHRIARIQPGETLIVSGATGTIGSIVGQLAKRHGCRVIGIAGGPQKCAHAREKLGFDTCLDHRDPAFAERLRGTEAQVYFENVGGAVLDAVLPGLAEHARIALCGMVAHYDTAREHRFHNLHLLLEKAIDVKPYRVSEHAGHHAAAMADLAAGVSAGDVMCDHTISRGLDSAGSAFVSMLAGKSLGKSLVKLDE